MANNKHGNLNDDLDLKDLESLLQGSSDENLAAPTSGTQTAYEKEVGLEALNVDENQKDDKSQLTKEPEELEPSAAATASKEQTAEKTPPPTKKTEDSPSDPDRNFDTLLSLPVDVSVVLGKTTLSVSDLLLMGQGSVIELDKLLGDDLDVFINGRPVAKGTIVLNNDVFGCKVTHILDPVERLRKLVMER